MTDSSKSCNPEILAPVGTEGSLEAAVYAGADAVYFGAGACNARRNAGQFTGGKLKETVRFCHAHGVGDRCACKIFHVADKPVGRGDRTRETGTVGKLAYAVFDIDFIAVFK